MLGLTSADLHILDPEQKAGSTSGKLTFASAGMVGDGFQHLSERVEEGDEKEVAVEEVVEIFLKAFKDREAERELVEKTEGLEVGGGVESGS